ncbi:MAG: 30S ribosome-binding factor RbfA [Eubacteriaceae bacterium]|nr:30S ribosome-binding factor RbfA [Eubacteriaceae bacterium]
MGKGYRQGRLGEEIRKVISEMLLRELKDPRLSEGMVSITSVNVSPDGSYATVYLSIFTENDDNREKTEEDIMAAMQSCKGLIKREIGHHVKVRHLPELSFKIDTSLEYGRHMDELIEEVVKKDGKE